MGQTHAKDAKSTLILDVNQHAADTFKRLLSEARPDLAKVGVAVIEACFKHLLLSDSRLCVPDFLFPADHVTLKIDLQHDQRGMAWKDVLAVKNGIHSIMVLRFRVPDVIDANFELPFTWHIMYAGDDHRSFNICSDHSTTILCQHNQ